MSGPLSESTELAGASFHPIARTDVGRLVRAASAAQTWLWAAYGPFLVSYGRSPSRAVLIGEMDDALVVLLRRRIRGQGHVDLIVPPLAAEPLPALTRITDALAAHNGGELETRLLWADLPAAALLADKPGWRVTPYEREYLYDRDAVLAMSGGAFRTLRKRVNRCEREAFPLVRDYTAAVSDGRTDRDACADLLREWQDVREPVVEPVFDFGYTMAALDVATEIGPPHLTGIVVEVDARVRAFAFGGVLRDDVACFFILKSDPTIHGLAEFARVGLMRRLDGCRYVNDAGDLGHEGLARHKSAFRPVGFVPTWKMGYSCGWRPDTPQANS